MLCITDELSNFSSGMPLIMRLGINSVTQNERIGVGVITTALVTCGDQIRYKYRHRLSRFFIQPIPG